MNAKVTWQGRLTFQGVADSGFGVTLGSELDVGGDNDGLRPMELIALGLAGCTAMDVISILQKKRQQVTAFETRVHAEQAQDCPRVFTHITITYFVEGHSVDPAAVERAIELSKTKYCPAQAMLKKAVKIEHDYQIKEAA